MRFGVSSFIFVSPTTDDDVGKLAEHVNAMGYEILEVAVEDSEVVSAEAINRASEATGLEISICGAFSPDRDVSHEEVEMREKGIDYLNLCVDLAQAVGSPNVSGPMYSATGKTRMLPDEEREKQRRLAAESLKEVGEYAGERGVGLAIEPLNRFETDLVNTVEQGLELCSRIGLDNVGLLLDTFHMNIEEKKVGDAVRLAAGRVRHVHVSENDRGTPGAGHVPWDELFQALSDIGYDDMVVVESFIPTIEAIARAVSLWRPVASSMDDLAKDGLAFLRQHRNRGPSL